MVLYNQMSEDFRQQVLPEYYVEDENYTDYSEYSKASLDHLIYAWSIVFSLDFPMDFGLTHVDQYYPTDFIKLAIRLRKKHYLGLHLLEP